MIGLVYIDIKVFSYLSYLLIAVAIFIAIFIFSDKSLSPNDKQRIGVIFIVAFFVIFFWSAFEQAGASLTFLPKNKPSVILVSLLFLPASFNRSTLFLSSLWRLYLPGSGSKWASAEPASPTKMAWGLFLLALGYLWIAFGVKDVSANLKVSMIWLIGMYFLHTCGELCLSQLACPW